MTDPTPSTSPLRIAIVGAGAIGGHFAARLAAAGHAVSMLARGDTLTALQLHGLRYTSGDQPQQQWPVQAFGDTADMGPQDLVILSVKSQALPAVAPTLAPLLHDETVVMPVGNGIPWWFFLVPGQPLSPLRLHSVDPGGAIERAIALPRVLAGTIMASCHCPELGVVVHSAGGRVTVGEPLGGHSARAEAWSRLLADAGLGASTSADIRAELWLKLLGNVSSNPLSLLTGVTTDRMLDDPDMRALFANMMNECIALGRTLGLTIATDAEQRMAQTRKFGAIRSSMLQDLEAGRSVELDAILGAPIECARAAKQPVPYLEAVFALACMRASSAGLR